MTTRLARLAALRRFALDFIVPAALAVAAITASPSASAQYGGGVDITISRHDGHGRVALGGLPPPPLLLPWPVSVRYVPVGWHTQPLHLRVPPHHARHWHYYCHRYHACNQRVIFVHGSWVLERHAMPHGHRHGHHHGYYRWHHREHDHRWRGYGPAPGYRAHR